MPHDEGAVVGKFPRQRISGGRSWPLASSQGRTWAPQQIRSRPRHRRSSPDTRRIPGSVSRIDIGAASHSIDACDRNIPARTRSASKRPRVRLGAGHLADRPLRSRALAFPRTRGALGCPGAANGSETVPRSLKLEIHDASHQCSPSFQWRTPRPRRDARCDSATGSEPGDCRPCSRGEPSLNTPFGLPV